MRHAVVCGLVALTLIIVPVASTRALCTRAPFEDSVGGADLIFIGTLDGSEATRALGTIITHHRFSEIRYVKGSGSTHGLILAQEGGRIGDEEIIVEDSIALRAGVRYVVFAYKGDRGDPKTYYIGSSCGPLYSFQRESPSGNRFVYSGNGLCPVVALQGRYIVMLRPQTQTWEAAHPRRLFPAERVPRRPITEEIRLDDSLHTANQVAGEHSRSVRGIMLWPHQDPSTRVGEAEFAGWLGDVCKGVAASSDSARVR